MSGIAAIYHIDGRPVDRRILETMTDIVSFRGPDGISHWSEGNVGLGHLQLATTPEARNERQPLASPDGRFVIAWDGRLDNREEMSGALYGGRTKAAGVPDARMVLDAYIAWGESCVKRMVGDFAFVVWDSVRQQMFCGRDPIGIRVLHYYFDGKVFVAGTQIRQVLVHPDVPCDLNLTKVGLYLGRHEGSPSDTFYKDIKRLPGGHALTVSRDGLREQVFWAPAPHDTIRLRDEEEYGEAFRELLFEAMRAQMRSSTSVGVMLSGGLDSAAVTCVGEELRRAEPGRYADIEAFSFVFRNVPETDETQYVNLIAEKYGTPVHWQDGDTLWEDPTEEDYLLDEPLKRPYERVQRGLFAAVRERNIRVLMTGEGGDEGLVARYADVFQHYLLRRQFGVLIDEVRAIRPSQRPRAIAMIARMALPNPFRPVSTSGRGDLSFPAWVNPRLRRQLDLDRLVKAQFPDRYRSRYWQDQLMTVESRGRAGMFQWGGEIVARYDIEWRHPLWDTRVVDFLVRVPPQVKLWHTWQKAVLRRALRGVLPEEIRRRRQKISFTPVFHTGLQGRDAPRLATLLDDLELARLGIINAATAKEGFRQYLDGDLDKGRPLFMLFVIEQWLKSTFRSNSELKRQRAATA